VRKDAYLGQIGVAPGDRIRQIDEMRIDNPQDFNKAIIAYRHKKSVVILLYRGNQGYYITVKLT